MNGYDNIFSEDVGSFFRSPVREIFKKVDLNSIYSFAGGYPSAETFPLEQIRKTMSEVIDKYAGKAFQYGATQGVPELREAVAKRYGVTVDRVQITSSSQQGIDVCTRVLVNPGDVILTSNPSYLGAIQSFCSYRADIRGIAHNDDIETLKTWQAFANSLNNVRKIEILPYHRLAINKYKKMGIPYRLENIPEPTAEQIKIAENINPTTNSITIIDNAGRTLYQGSSNYTDGDTLSISVQDSIINRFYSEVVGNATKALTATGIFSNVSVSPYLDIDFSQVRLFIWRGEEEPQISKPCAACEKAIRDLGIKRVFYTGHNSYVEEFYN